jgi:nucleoside recognition membrane protein YjiH
MEPIPVKFTPRALLRLIVCSAFGIFAFFINIPFPAYTIPIVNGAVAAQSTISVNHLVNFVKGLLWWGDFKAMPYAVLLIGVYGVADLYARRKKHFGSSVSIAFSVFKLIGMAILVMIVFNVGPAVISTPLESLGDLTIGQFIMNNILISICISVPAAAVFLAFLLDYGLVDFVGVLFRLVMRPVFRLPGRAAVILVAAFLGNFSVGHIAINDRYKSGRMTEREAVVIGSSLSTVSVGFLMVLATNTHLMSHWNTYFWTAFLITLLVTLVGVRIPPLRGVPDNYRPGMTPTPETAYKTGIWRNALKEAVHVAETADNPLRRMRYFQKETIVVLGTVATGTSFFATFGVLLYTYTPLFQIIGYAFYPLMRLFVPGSEAFTASTGAAISFLEVTIPALLVTTGTWSLRIRYMMAVLPVTAIVFLASFVPCLMGTEVPVRFWHLAVIWVERMFLAILIAGVFAVLLFPAGAV